jgi:hypothetical protein
MKTAGMRTAGLGRALAIATAVAGLALMVARNRHFNFARFSYIRPQQEDRTGSREAS